MQGYIVSKVGLKLWTPSALCMTRCAVQKEISVQCIQTRKNEWVDVVFLCVGRCLWAVVCLCAQHDWICSLQYTLYEFAKVMKSNM